MPKQKDKRAEALKKANEFLKGKNKDVARQASELHKNFEALRKETDELSQDKIPWIREYYKLFTKQEKNEKFTIGLIAKEKDNIVLQQGVLNIAASLCDDPEVKESLLKESEELKNHQAIKNYEKFNKGLQFILGKEEVPEKDVEAFFRDELGNQINLDNSTFMKDRKRSFQEVKKTEDSLEVQFMDEIAVVKAQQFYGHEGVNYEAALTDQFLGDWPQSKRPKETEYRDRMSPGAACFVYMLEKGYKAEDILDPRKLRDEKKEVGKIYRKNREEHNLNWLAERFTKGCEALMEATQNYMINHKDELKNEEDMALHGNRLGLMIHYCYDMAQEVQRCNGVSKRTTFAEQTGQSYDYMNDLADRLNKYGSLNNWMSFAIPKNLAFVAKDKVGDIVVSQLQVKQLLGMIKREEPDMESQFLEFQQSYDLKVQLFEMPEFKEHLRGRVERTKDKIKIYGNILRGDYIKEKQLDYVIPEYTIKSKEATKDELELITISKGQKLTAALMSGEKQVVATKVPVHMGPFLGELESKRGNFRGNEKGNSEEFNRLLKAYDEVVDNMCKKDISENEKLENLAKIKEAATAYVLAKRAQKGHKSKDVPDKTVDKTMLGLGKGKSIVTTRGRERYAFAERLIGNAMKMEKAIAEAQTFREQKEAHKEKMKALQKPEVKENTGVEVEQKETKTTVVEKLPKENVLEEEMEL